MKPKVRPRQVMLPGMDTPIVSTSSADAWTMAASNAGASWSTREMATWRPSRLSADSELLPEQGTLVSRARDLDRNSGIAKGGIQTVVDNVVGVGLRLNPRPNYVALGQSKEWADEWAANVRALWFGWAETTACDAADTMIFDQMTAQILRSQMVSGEACALPLWLPGRPDGWSTKIQTIDPDRLSTPTRLTESLRLRGGIETDEYGAPTAYYFRLSHPGDFLLPIYADSWKWERIPKYTAFGRRRVIHCYDKDRTGQSRGKPALSSVLVNFKGLDRYTAAEIEAAVVNGMIATTIETPLDQEGIEALFQNNSAAYLKARQEHATTIESGLLVPLFPGDKLNAFAPSRPSSGFGPFVSNVTRIIALALDMPGELLMKDFTQANYSSMRAAMLEAWRSFNRRRDDLGTQWADPVYALWLEEAINAGKVDAPDFYENRYAYTRCKWIGPGRGWVDPVKEADAAVTRMAGGLSTMEKECAEQGEDWRDVLDQQAVELAYREKLGLPAPATPGAKVAGAGYPSDNQEGIPSSPPPEGPTMPDQAQENTV